MRNFSNGHTAADLSSVHKQLEIAAKERAELRSQVSSLVSHSQELTKQMEELSEVLSRNCSQNLVHLHAIDEHVKQQRTGFRPLPKDVADQPTHVSQIGNVSLFELAMHGKHSANKERLIREIMQVDGLSWEDAHAKLNEMDVCNEEYYWRDTMPYRIGILGALFGAVAGTAMVFFRPVAQYYGLEIAGEDLPEGVEDISSMTVNQVGTWTWSWMEPMIGTASFVILCSQFARAQMWKLNMRPYTESMLRTRANRLAKEYPHYDAGIVRAWAKHMPMVNTLTVPTYRRNLGWRQV